MRFILPPFAANVVAVAIISTPERLSLWGVVGDVADKNARIRVPRFTVLDKYRPGV